MIGSASTTTQPTRHCDCRAPPVLRLVPAKPMRNNPGNSVRTLQAGTPTKNNYTPSQTTETDPIATANTRYGDHESNFNTNRTLTLRSLQPHDTIFTIFVSPGHIVEGSINTYRRIIRTKKRPLRYTPKSLHSNRNSGLTTSSRIHSPTISHSHCPARMRFQIRSTISMKSGERFSRSDRGRSKGTSIVSATRVPGPFVRTTTLSPR